MEEAKPRKVHIFTIDQRKNGIITGVEEVISFDTVNVVIQTCQGMLTIHGQNLHVSSLDLEEGRIQIDGQIDSAEYSKEIPGVKKESTFARWFR